MATTASDVLIETLMEWGVKVVFGLPGDGINGIMEALRIRQDKIRLRSSPSRRKCGFHGLRLRQVHGKIGRLFGHVGGRAGFIS